MLLDFIFITCLGSSSIGKEYILTKAINLWAILYFFCFSYSAISALQKPKGIEGQVEYRFLSSD
jgi:hypothetical protein